ncbi:hypothetical protein DSO57_1034214 [Entomophthora muscae]|uniref:Uncharacterized protein n=1 Tax=Entomophthora muscae TaxID=34485 RepID=A0ACC2T068_9FUNG|nr:hypothetical protein DSO57_1034214 [Entomophthora muscae]
MATVNIFNVDMGAVATEDGLETWDILKVHNICNYEKEFQLPDILSISFPIMSSKGNAGFYHDGFMFKCNNEALGASSLQV